MLTLQVEYGRIVRPVVASLDQLEETTALSADVSEPFLSFGMRIFKAFESRPHS